MAGFGEFDDLVPGGTIPAVAPTGSLPVSVAEAPSLSFDDLLPRNTTPKSQEAGQRVAAAVQQDMSAATMGGDLVRSAHSLKRGAKAGMYMLGLEDDIDDLANTFANSDAIEAQYPKSRQRVDLDTALARNKATDNNEFWSSLGNTAASLAQHPRGTASLALEQMATMVPSLGGALAGGLAGSLAGPVGTVAGAYGGMALGSGFTDYGSSFEDYIRDKKKPKDAMEWKAALMDKDLVNEAHWYAAKHSGAVAAFDVVGAKLGGKLAARYFVPGTSIGKKAGAVAGAVGIDALSEGAGEATGQFWGKGAVDWQEVGLEAWLGGGMGAANVAIEPVLNKVTGKSQPAASIPDLDNIRTAFDDLTPTPGGVPSVPEQQQSPQRTPSDPPLNDTPGLGDIGPNDLITPYDIDGVLPAKETPEKIVGPAVKIGDRVFTGAFHPDAFERAAQELGVPVEELAKQVGKEPGDFQGDVAYRGGVDVDGFLTSTGRYVGREEAGRIAEGVQQTVTPHQPGAPLSSEGLAAWDDKDIPNFMEIMKGAEAPASGPSLPPGVQGNPLQGPTRPDWRSSLPPEADRTWKVHNHDTSWEPKGEGETKFVLAPQFGDITGVISHPNFQMAERVARGIGDIYKRLGIKAPLMFTPALPHTQMVAGKYGFASYRWKGAQPHVTGFNRPYNIIVLNLAMLNNPGEMISIAAHEMGHIIQNEMYASAPPATLRAVQAAYQEWKVRNPEQTGFAEMLRTRTAPTSPYVNTRPDGRTLSSFTETELDYWIGFDEWFAEQVARWATTDAKPLSSIERFFSGIARKLLEVFNFMEKKFGTSFRASDAMRTFLDSNMAEGAKLESKLVMDEINRQSKLRNQRLINRTAPDVNAEPEQVEFDSVRTMIDKIFNGTPPVEVREMGAWADKFNAIYKYALTVIQVAKRNTHISELQRYVETMNAMHLDEHRIQDAALTVMKAWRKLGAQGNNVAGLIDDLMNKVYLTPDERKQNVRRMPTAAEFQQLVGDNKVSDQGLRVYKMIQKMFNDFLAANQELARENARATITDQMQLLVAIADINARFDAMRQVPYFPAMRFGNHTITVRDAARKILHFETVEGRRFKTAKQVQKTRQAELARDFGVPLEQVQIGILAEDARPLLGMPAAMLDLMAQKLNLSATQAQALEQLKFEYSPPQSFKHRLQKKNFVEGYSQDFKRAFANYFFHGSKYFAKVKYVSRLEGYIQTIREQTKFMPDSIKRTGIANYLSDHLQNALDPKPDFAALRSMMFMWALGFSPAAATLNLSQMPMITYPFLASKFGDRRTSAEMIKAGTNVKNFYKRGKYENMTDFHWRAISEGIKQGTITEAMAPELAAMTDGRNLGQGFGGNALQRGWQKFQEYGSFMFEMAEQVNRRVTFRAALELALKDPSNKHIDEVVAQNQLQYQRLLAQNWSEAEARAYITAQDAVTSTQYMYARWAQARFMRGKWRSVFVFKSFLQNSLFFLWNYPQAAWRTLLILGFLGGLMGLPGGDDLKGALRALAWQLFGKDFDLEREARRFIVDMSNGTVPPDLLLHGMARRGFGIPAMADLFGNAVGRGTLEQTWYRLLWGKNKPGPDLLPVKPAVPLPILDRSQALSMGHILPADLGKLFGPTTEADKAIASEIPNASGAVFSTMFNIYRALVDTKLEAGDTKRWEKAVPRSMASVSRSYRAFTEGRERNRSGATVTSYDIHDTEQMMEALALAGGYANLRTSSKWNQIIAQQEVIKFWDTRRSGILQQYYQAISEGTPQDIERMKSTVKQFNAELPESAKGKTISSETIQKSMAARRRSIEAQESGVAVIKANRGIQQDIQRLFPEGTVDVRRVK